MVIAPKTIVMYKLHSLFNKVRTKSLRLFSSSVSPKGCHLPRWGRLFLRVRTFATVIQFSKSN